MPGQFWFLNCTSGESWPVHDPVAWCLDNASQPLLERARQRLITLGLHDDPQRILNVVLRRCDLNLIEIVKQDQIVAHSWTRQADLRPFFKEMGLARPEVRVTIRQRKRGLDTTQAGDDFLYGDRLDPEFPWTVYHQKWECRSECEADDWQGAPRSPSVYSWKGAPASWLPWAALKSAWRREQAPVCPNCDVSLWLLTFDCRRISQFSMEAFLTRCCFTCRRRSDTAWPASDLSAWIVANLDVDVFPQSHAWFGRIDLKVERAQLSGLKIYAEP